MLSTKVTVGQPALASQYDNLRKDAYGGSVLFVHQQSSPGMTLYVENGAYYIQGARYLFAGGNTPTITAPVSNPRIDLVCMATTGITIVTGSESASPSAPAYPTDKLVLAEVYNVVGETAIYDNDSQVSGQGYIYNDVRPFLLTGIANENQIISGVIRSLASGEHCYAPDTSGSANIFTIAVTPAATAYNVGDEYSFIADNANTGPSTLNVNSLGAISIKKNYNAALQLGDIVAGQMVTVIYDGTNFQIPVSVATQSNSQLIATSPSSQTTSGTTPMSVISATLPGNSLGTKRAVKINFSITGGTSGGSYSFTVKLNYGGSTITNITIAGSNGSSDPYWGIVEVILYANGATNLQYGTIAGLVNSAGINMSGGASTGSGAGAVDSTANQTLQVTVTANISSATTYGGVMQLL